MALAEPTTAEQESHDQAHVAGSGAKVALVVCLGPSYTDAAPEQLEALLPLFTSAGLNADGARVLVGYPATRNDAASEERNGFLLQPFMESVSYTNTPVQTAASWLNTYELLRAHKAQCCLLLGAESQTIHPEAITALRRAVCDEGTDLAVPRYAIHSNQSLLNTGVLSPLSQAIFNVDLHFPLTLDYACSPRMAERMAAAAQRFTTVNQGDAIVWPIGEAAGPGYSFAEIAAGHREIPQVQDDLTTILNRVVGTLFTDVEAKAAFWQRTRPQFPVKRMGEMPPPTADWEGASSEEIAGLAESFRQGYKNLHEIWSLVLPPNTLVALKRLSVAPLEQFNLPDAVWVRIVYDFVLAHRLRTIARNHLMGVFAPLYLAWVASHLSSTKAAGHLEALARAFEADKPYLVSRWRWPDRFNP